MTSTSFIPWFAKGILLMLLLAAGMSSAAGQQLPTFSQVVVFGDSLSDTGNIRARTEDQYFIGYPGGSFNYSDGRFTNSSDTDPPSRRYAGVWHEQLARLFLNLPPATASLRGGRNYAYGGATTRDGTSERTLFANPDPFIGGTSGISIDNMGRQLDRFLNQQTVDAGALHVLWGGGNDLFDDQSPENVVATSGRVVGLVNRLVNAGARQFLIPNVPPLGGVPQYAGNEAKQAALNRASRDYRIQLNADLNTLEETFARQGFAVRIYRVDVWARFISFAANPGAYGFSNVSDNARGNSSVDADTYTFWDGIHPTTAGHFQVAQEAARVLAGNVGPTAPAMAVSSRVTIGAGDNSAIGGFIVTGSAPKRVLVRGIGPSLAAYGVAGVLPDPNVTLFDAERNVIATNDNWQQSQRAEIVATELAPADPREAALIATLLPGDYTAVATGSGNSSGIGLVQIYDLEPGSAGVLAALSTRGYVGTDDNVLIGGLTIGPGESPTVVLRAIGPDLASYGVSGALADPVLEVYDANGLQIGANDDWRSGQPIALKGAVLAPGDDRDAAFIAPLAPGNYTAVVRGKGNTSGVALVEAYRIP